MFKDVSVITNYFEHFNSELKENCTVKIKNEDFYCQGKTIFSIVVL